MANLAGILDRCILEMVPTCGGMDGNAGTWVFAFRREGANVYVSLPAGFAAFGEVLKAGIKYLSTPHIKSLGAESNGQKNVVPSAKRTTVFTINTALSRSLRKVT